MDDTRPREGVLKLETTGRSATLWAELRPKLMLAITRVLDTVADHERNSTIRDEAKRFTSALLRHAEARLEKPGLENEKIEAEVAEVYAKVETERAQARKVNAEAEAQELSNSIRKLKLLFMCCKVCMAGDDGEEALMLGTQMQSFLASLEELAVEERP
jgi:hypothetical protein